MTPYLADLGISFTMIGIIGGAYGVSQLMIRVPLGIISDRLGKRKIFLIFGLIAVTISSFAMFLTENAYVFLFMRLLAGVAASAWVIFTVLYTGYFEKEKQASRMQHLLIANFGGLMISRLVGGMVAERFGHEFTFLAGGLAGIIAIVLCLFITEKATKPDELPSIRTLFEVVKNKNLMIMSVLAAFNLMVLHSTINTFTSQAGEQAGAGSLELGIIAMVSSIPGIITSIICGRYFAKHKVNLQLIMAVAFFVQIIGALVIVFGTLSITAVYISAIVIASGCGLGLSVQIGFCTSTVEENRRTAAMGFFQSIYAIGMIIGPVIMGAFVDSAGLAGGFLAAAVFAVIGMVLSVVLIRKQAT